MVDLSKKAKEDLKTILIKEVGLEVANSFTEEELNRVGNFLLSTTMEYLKMSVNN